MSRFEGKVALVFGASGNVGLGIVKALAEEGAQVITPSRTKNSLEAIKKFSGHSDRIFPIEGDLSTLEGAEKVKQVVQSNFKKIDYVVSSLGGWAQVSGPITKISKEEYELAYSNYVTPHWNAAKHFLPWLSESSSDTNYLIVTGAGGEYSASPEMGHLTLGAASLFGLSQAIQAEYRKSSVRVNEYRIAIRVVRDDEVKQSFENPTSKAGKAVANALLQNARSKIFKLTQENLNDQVANKF